MAPCRGPPTTIVAPAGARLLDPALHPLRVLFVDHGAANQVGIARIAHLGGTGGRGEALEENVEEAFVHKRCAAR